LKRKVTPLLILLLLAFGLRVWGLDDHNIWWDEGVGAWLARLPAGTIVHWTAHDVHPPLYYLLTRGWWSLVGDGAFVLRFPSAVAGTLAVAAIYGLGRALGGRQAGLLSALFLTVSRFAIFWSQEIRMYALATLLTTGALWAAVRAWRGGGWRAWLGYVLAATGSLYALYLTAPVLVITNLAFPLAWLRSGRPRRLLVRWIAAQLAVASLFAPWLAYALPRMHSWASDSAFSPGFFVQLYATMLAVGVPVDIEAYLLPTVGAFAVLMVGLVVLWRTWCSPPQRAGAVMLLLGLALPALIVYVVSSPLFGFYYARPLVPRYLLPLAPCFYALTGWGVAGLARRRRWTAWVGSGLVVAVALSGLASFYPGRARRDEFVSLAATIEAHRHPGDAVVLHTDVGWPVFAAHYPGDWRGVPSGMEVDAAAADGLLRPIWEQASGVWLVTTPDAQRADPEAAIERWLAARAVSSVHWDFGENALTFFARTPERGATRLAVGPGFVPPRGPRAEIPPDAVLLGAWVPLPRYPTGDTVHLALSWDPPPGQAVVVTMVGPGVEVRVTDLPRAVQAGPTRQQIDLPLTPNLPAGRYRLVLTGPGEEELGLGSFTLVRREVEGTASPTDVPSPLDLRFGEAIRLVGYDLRQTAVAPGEVVEVTLYWQAAEVVGQRYKVFVHVLGETYNAATRNFLWGQQDSEPLNGQAPTTVWTPGTVIADPYRVTVAPDAPPDRYSLEVGLYGLVDGDRLPIFTADGDPLGDALILSQIEVRAP
jgi:4-amino-4-deoxy-L-arabinose transferase-like glycosyltransferase